MAESLGNRQFQSLRRVQPNRLVDNSDGAGRHHEEYAVAVVDPEGSGIGQTTEELLGEILLELRALRTGMILAGFAEEVDVA